MKFKNIIAISAAAFLMSTQVGYAASSDLETVVEFNDTRPGNVTITPQGRIIVSMQPLDGPKLRVVEVMADGSKRPFPTLDWADGPENGSVGIASIIGIDTDSEGIVWMLDMGAKDVAAKLVAWDSVNELIHKIIIIDPKALVGNSFLQDLAIDEANGKIYISDMTLGNFVGATKPAIIVVDIKTGNAKRVLESTVSFMPPERDVIIEGGLLASKAEDGTVTKLRFGMNPIAIDDKNEWIYYGTINGEKIFRIPTASLADVNITDAERATTIEEFGPKKPSDGIYYASGHGVLTSDIENNAIGLTTKGKYEIIVQDDQLSWPDGFDVTNDGWVYVTQNQLHLHPAFSQGKGQSTKPYKLMRFKIAK